MCGRNMLCVLVKTHQLSARRVFVSLWWHSSLPAVTVCLVGSVMASQDGDRLTNQPITSQQNRKREVGGVGRS